jgi:SAM-dependent methyltransferase
MIICPTCTKENSEWTMGCTHCGFKTKIVDGFRAWAPDVAQHNDANSFFEPATFKQLAAREDANFWFKSRNKLILNAIQKHCKFAAKFMEVGCGTGYVLSAVEAMPQFEEIIGTELFVEGLKFAQQRCSRASLLQMDARAMPYVEHFDAIGTFDVLEHIEDDVRVLSQMHRALKPNGHLLITVPQHPWLWSAVDEAACHVRRYTKTELHTKIKAAGFEVIQSTSFVSLLMPLMLVSRLIAPKNKSEASAELEINPLLNQCFNFVMWVERGLLRLGLNFAFGGSRIVVARKI